MNYYFIRHAESEGNANPTLYHHKEDHLITLTAKGKLQCVECVDRLLDILDGETIDYNNLYLYHSSYLRACETKDLIIKELEYHYIFPKIEMSTELRERSWGDLRNLIETQEDISKYFNFFYKPTNNGESFLECYQRCVVFDNMLKNQLSNNSNVIIVGHGEQIKCYLMHLLGWTLEEFDSYANPDNCEVIMVTDGKLSARTPLKKRIKN